MKDLKVLFYSEPFGSGHEKAAEGLAAGLGKVYKQIKISSVHAMTQFTPKMSAIVQKTYMGLLKAVPFVWGRFYEKSKDPAAKVDDLLSKFYEEKMYQYTVDYNPDIIVCTHPFPAAVVGTLRKKERLKIPLVGVVTDFDVHTTWINDQVDLFILQNETVARDLVNYGIDRSKVNATGIPVHPVFAKQVHKASAKAQLGLDSSLPVIVVGGGGWGLGPIEKIVKQILALEQTMQIVVVCGINNNLRKRLETLSAQYPNLFVLGYVGNINELISAADVLVSKPGGLTSSEALVKGIPMVTFEAFGGQETYNAKYLNKIGAAVSPYSQNFAQTVMELVNSPGRREEMKRAAQSFAKPASAIDGANLILDLA